MSKVQEYIDKKFTEKYNTNFKGWMLDKLITDLTRVPDYSSLTEANIEEAKVLLEIYERRINEHSKS